MSYVDNKQDEEKKENEKIENPFKALLSGETIEESPDEIIAKDSDSERKELFRKTYDALLHDMYPTEEEVKKKKKKKEQKKTTAGTMEQSADKAEKKVVKKKEDSKEIER